MGKAGVGQSSVATVGKKKEETAMKGTSLARASGMPALTFAKRLASLLADRRPQTADRRPQTADRRPQTADRRPQTADRRPQTADRRPQTADRRPQTADRRPQTALSSLDASQFSPGRPSVCNGRPSLPHASPILPDARSFAAALVLFLLGAGTVRLSEIFHRGAADAMGRARFARRERDPRPSTGSARRLIPGLRRPAGAASPSTRSRSLRFGATAACLLAFALLVPAPALAQDTSAPTLASAERDSNLPAIDLTFNKALGNAVPDPAAFALTVDGASRSVLAVRFNAAVAPKTLRLLFQGSALTDRDTVRVSYDPSKAGGSTREIQDLAGNRVGGWKDWLVKTDFTAPALESAAVNGTALTLTWNETVDPEQGEFGGPAPAQCLLPFATCPEPPNPGNTSSGPPPASAFTVKGIGADQTPSAVSVSGRTVELTLARGATAGRTVTVSYARPAENPLRDVQGNVAANLTDRAVTNDTPRVGPLPSRIRADAQNVYIEFDRNISTGSTGSHPMSGNRCPASQAFTLKVNGVASGSWATRGVTGGPTGGNGLDGWRAKCTARQIHLELWDGPGYYQIPAGSTVTLSYDPNLVWTGPERGRIFYADGTVVPAFTDKAVQNNTPHLKWASVNGTDLLAYFGYSLATWSVPAPEAFTVMVNNERRNVVAGGISFFGNHNGGVKLTLESPVYAGDAVTLDYTRPSQNPLRGTRGNPVVPDIAETGVRNDTPVPVAPSGVLVSNKGKPTHFWEDLASGTGFAQSFTTGNHDSGYRLTSVELVLVRPQSGMAPTYSVTIRAVDSGGHPGNTLGTLRNPNSLPTSYQYSNFEATGTGIELAANTNYVVAIETSGAVRLIRTTGGGIDPGSKAGWSLGERYVKGTDGTWGPAVGANTVLSISGRTASGASGNSGPSPTSSSVSGTQLKMTFDATLSQGLTPPGGSFKVTVEPQPQGGARGNGGAGANGGAGGFGDGFGTGAQGTSGVRGASGGGTADIPGTGTVTVDGTEVTVTLARAVPPGSKVTVAYTPPPDHSALRNLAGEKAEAFSGEPVAHATSGAPAVTGVAVVSDAGADGTYALGDTVEVRVTFSEAVAVDTSGGAPNLAIDMDPADWGEKRAAYAGGSGTAELVFAHEVVEPNVSTQGIAVLADSLALAGGTIRSVADGTDAALAHAGLGHDASHKVDWTLSSNRAPVVDEQSQNYAGFVASGAAPRGVLVTKDFEGIFSDPDGDELTYTVTLSDSGQAALVETLHVLTKAELAESPRPEAVAHLVWFRADAAADWDAMTPAVPDPVEIRATVTATDPEGLSASVEGVFLTHWGPPRVASVAVASNAGNDDTYALGDIIRVAVRFDDPVAVDTSGGVPRLAIDMDPADWGRKWASYASGSGTRELVFAYAVAEPNYSTQGIAVLADSLELNGGGIHLASAHLASVTDGTAAALGHAGLGHDPRHKVDWQRASSPPAAAPAVTGVAVASNAGSDDTYGLGDVIRVAVTFDAAVTVTGTPGLAIDMDPAAWGEKRAAYESGSGTATLTFAHTVVEPNYSTQGIAVLANSLALDGGAIRTASGADAALGHAGLGHDARHKVDWRPEFSVADAEANEGADATVDFQVTLSRAFTTAAHAVTVDYATADGTATAGEDYTATSGTLTFAAGETEKTVSVPILDDALDEGSETFTLRLSNAQGARIADGEAKGTIKNDDPMPKAWTARFGRSVAVHVLDAVTQRLDEAPGSWVQLGGHRLGGGPDVQASMQHLAPELSPSTGSGQALWAEADASDPAGRALAFRDLLMGSAFHLVSNPEDKATGPRLSAWGRVATSGFDGREDRLSLDGTVTTATLGVDGAWERWLTGLLLAHSEGDGSFTHLDVPGGDVSSSLTSVHPYVAYRLNDRVRLWGLVGYGGGDLQLRMEDRRAMDTDLEDERAEDTDPEYERAMDTDLTMTMGALGMRGSLLDPSRPSGIQLALRSDVLWMVMDSDAAANLAATEAEASRLRLVLEGSKPVALAGGGSFTPSLEVGLRHDGGDAETGTGLEVGGSARYTSAWGLSIEASVRGLLAHEAEDYTEWGASGALRFDPGKQGRGFTASIAPAWGSAASGMSRLWDQTGTAGLVTHHALAAATGRLDAELGYGLAALNGRGLLTPYARVALSEGADQAWHLGTRLALRESLNLSLEASRRGREGETAAHELALRATLGW